MAVFGLLLPQAIPKGPRTQIILFKGFIGGYMGLRGDYIAYKGPK